MQGRQTKLKLQEEPTQWCRRVALVTALILVLSGFGFGVYCLSQINYECDWTGFGECRTTLEEVKDGKKEERIDLRRGKTLWDWMGLLGVPLVLAIGGYLFNRSEKRREQVITEQRARDEALESYLDQMTHLMLGDGKLWAQGEAGQPSRSIARARTLDIFKRLNDSQKSSILQLLYESKLLATKAKPAKPIVDLYGAALKDANLANLNSTKADLTGVTLIGANLTGTLLGGTLLWGSDLTNAYLTRASLEGTNLAGATLEGANLMGAILKDADLRRANLLSADLTEANLESANLEEANLAVATLKDANLSKANLSSVRNLSAEKLKEASRLRGATMTDGSLYKGHLNLKGDEEDAQKQKINLND